MHTMNWEIRAEKPGDVPAVREVNRLAFGREDEAKLVDDLRNGTYARISLVARREDKIVGHVMFSALSLETEYGSLEALALAPVAVVPEAQGQGVGSALIQEGLRRCAGLGHSIAIVLGEPDYYSRFGFSSTLARKLRSRYSGEAFMALELTPQALNGVEGDVRYSPPFEDA
jgi:putative acetyltransferase